MAINIDASLVQDCDHIQECIISCPYGHKNYLVRGIQVTSSPQSFSFNALTDENGTLLPQSISNAFIMVSARTERTAYPSSVSTTGFSLTLSSFGAEVSATVDLWIVEGA